MQPSNVTHKSGSRAGLWGGGGLSCLFPVRSFLTLLFSVGNTAFGGHDYPGPLGSTPGYTTEYDILVSGMLQSFWFSGDCRSILVRDVNSYFIASEGYRQTFLTSLIFVKQTGKLPCKGDFAQQKALFNAKG